mgnify:CR=1 FL=1
MLFDRFRKKEKKAEELRMGKRFAVKYGSITSPLAEEEEHPYYSVMIINPLWKAEEDSIDELWTVVEYIGEGKYLDLVTGEIYPTQKLDITIRDTVTREYEEEALKDQEELLTNPLSIISGRHRGLTETMLRPAVCELTPEIKKSILEETMPQQEHIQEVLAARKKFYIEKLKQFYETKNGRKMVELQKAAQEEDRRYKLEQDRIKAEQERIRKEQEQEEMRRRQEEERAKLKVLIDPLFEQAFPTTKDVKQKRKRK